VDLQLNCIIRTTAQVWLKERQLFCHELRLPLLGLPSGHDCSEECYRSSREHQEMETGNTMIYTLAVVLIVLWLLGWISDVTTGGVIHLLLLAALILIVAQFIQGRKSHRKNLKS
jgi:hypothetical protein